MKHLILAAVVSLAALAAPAHADITKTITSYDVELYDSSTSSEKLGIIRLYSAGTSGVVAYLHFHRSSTTMPADRTYVSGSSVHAHYYSSDWERFLALLDHDGAITFQFTSYYENVYLNRNTTVN